MAFFVSDFGFWGGGVRSLSGGADRSPVVFTEAVGSRENGGLNDFHFTPSRKPEHPCTLTPSREWVSEGARK